jgi:hypothetical protein
MSPNPANNIFFNLFQFTFCNSSTESDYQKMREEKLKFYNKIILCVMLLETVMCTLFNSFFLESYHINNVFKFDIISSYIDTILYLVLLFIGWYSENIRLIRWIHYLTYYLKIFFTISTRHIIIYYTNFADSILSVFYLYEINFRLIWVLFYVHSFYENFFLNLFSIATLYLTYPFLSTYEENSKGMQDIKTYSFFLLSVCCFCYILERFLRTSYYYNWSSVKKAEWLSNVLDNMNSGFISLKGGKITFINIFLLKYLKKLKFHCKLESQRNDHQMGISNQERKDSKILIL